MSQPAPRRAVELKIEDAAAQRRLDCAGYGACLSIAVDKRWESFACTGCEDYAQLDAQQLAHDLDALLDLMAAIHGA